MYVTHCVYARRWFLAPYVDDIAPLFILDTGDEGTIESTNGRG